MKLTPNSRRLGNISTASPWNILRPNQSHHLLVLVSRNPRPISSLSLDNKAIKNRFNIVAGEVSNLYKSTKPSKKMKAQVESITIDLHGYTKEAAVEKLNASLPSWIDAAMRGDYPFVVPVTIICGAGGQVLSEVVEQWIRDNERVANARKNMFI